MMPSFFETCAISNELAACFPIIDEKRAQINRYVNLHLKANHRPLDSHQSCEDSYEQFYNNKKKKFNYHIDNVGILMVYSKRLLNVRWVN